MHYKGQSFELVVPVPDGPIDAAMVAHLEEAFGREHEKTYGHRAGPEEPVELVSIQVVGQGLREGSGVPERVRAEPLRDASPGRRAAPTSALRTAGSRRRSSSAPTWRRAGRARSSSRNTMPPAWSRPAPPPSSTPAEISSSSWNDHPAASDGSHSAICGHSDSTTIISSMVTTNGEAPMMTSSIRPRLRRPCTT